jgi:hypothetical protein
MLRQTACTKQNKNKSPHAFYDGKFPELMGIIAGHQPDRYAEQGIFLTLFNISSYSIADKCFVPGTSELEPGWRSNDGPYLLPPFDLGRSVFLSIEAALAEADSRTYVRLGWTGRKIVWESRSARHLILRCLNLFQTQRF